MKENSNISLLLVVPPQKGLLEGFSAGLISIANYVEERTNNVDVSLLDYQNATFEFVHSDIYTKLQRGGRIVVGVTGTTASYQSMLKVAEIVKIVNPTAIVLFGGHHVSSQDDVVLNNHGNIVDLVAVGEGELTVLELLNNLDKLQKVPGISYLEDGELRRNRPPRPLDQEELDSISPIYDESSATLSGKFDFVTYVSARGCPLKCSFCVVRATKIRSKSIEVIINDLENYIVEHGVKRIAIEDNFFAHQPKRTLALCAAIAELRKQYDFEWDCQTRVESLRKKEVVQSLKVGGCSAAYIGVEALVAEHLIYLGKATKPEFYLQQLEDVVIPNMLEADLSIYINLQMGFRGESSGIRARTNRALEKLGNQVADAGKSITVFPQLNVLYPGTPLFLQALDSGVFGPDGQNVFERFTKWEEKEEPIKKYLSLHFAHGIGGIPLGLLDGVKLKNSQFEVDTRGLFEIVNQLNEWEGLRGIKVFKYGAYLAAQEEAYA